MLLKKPAKHTTNVQQTRYENFDSIPRSKRLMEILVNGGNLPSEVSCQDGGSYVVDQAGKWSCSVHGVFDEERLARGKRKLALLAGEAPDESEFNDDYDESGDY